MPDFKVINIVKGFWKWMTNHNEKLAAERMSVCYGCPKRGIFTSPLIRPAPFICTECGCFLKAKTREESEKCPLNKWKR